MTAVNKRLTFADPFGLKPDQDPCFVVPGPGCIEAMAAAVNDAALQVANILLKPVAFVASLFTPGSADELLIAGSIPVVRGAVSKISSKIVARFGGSVDEWVEAAKSSGTRYVDTKNNGNINYFMDRPDGRGLIRITMDPDEQRVISGGLNKYRDLESGLERGRFVQQ